MKEDLAKAEVQVGMVKDKASALTQAVDPSSAVKVKKQVHDLDILLEDVQEETSRLDAMTEQALCRAENYENLCQVSRRVWLFLDVLMIILYSCYV